jgi:hypothetical protein
VAIAREQLRAEMFPALSWRLTALWVTKVHAPRRQALVTRNGFECAKIQWW